MKHCEALPLWSIVFLATSISTVVITIGIQLLINDINVALSPCVHGGVYNGSQCDCSNSNGLFSGQYCESDNCHHNSILMRHTQQISDDILSMYSCRCPQGPTKRWTGFLCDKCYATNNVTCTGDCDSQQLLNYYPYLESPSVTAGSKQHCDNICLPRGNESICDEIDVGHNGQCVSCNGHGTCNTLGTCVCDLGWLNKNNYDQCSISCLNSNGTSLCGKNAICNIVDNRPKCFCKKGFFNEPTCDITCPGLDPDTAEGSECYGHGSCYYEGIHQLINTHKYAFCKCEPLYDADGEPSCQYKCPHRDTVQTACSGHGKCRLGTNKAMCDCDNTWGGNKCDCNDLYTCSGHGSCHPTTGECQCYSGGTLQDLQSTYISVELKQDIPNVPNTYSFVSEAHYVVIEDIRFNDLIDGIILNLTSDSAEMPVVLKTFVKQDNKLICEFDENQANAVVTFFGNQFDNMTLKIPYNWNPRLKPDMGFYAGPRCLECQHNWFPSPVAGSMQESCNVYCNPSAEYKWHDTRSTYMYPFGGQPGFGCWGRGQCEYEPNPSMPDKLPSCKCKQGTDPERFCAQCLDNLYPKLQWVGNPIVDYCTEECIDNTCNGHGKCNPLAYSNTQEQLCICNLNVYGMDTINASQRCIQCQDNWFPGDINDVRACSEFCSSDLATNMASGCEDLVRNYTDIKEDMLMTTFNRQEEEKQLSTRIAAAGKSRLINCLNCQAGTCNEKAQCTCPDGVTGVECQQACRTHNNQVCAGHGVCSQNELYTHFNPSSDLTQCECSPQDEYTPDTRDFYQRTGVNIDPPPSKEYYGQTCEYHCPTYNQDICAKRGQCHPIPVEGSHKCKQSIKLSDDDNPFSCKNVMQGESIDGVFCSVTSSPWDSKASEEYKVNNYFISPSPGSVQCKNSKCQSEVNTKDWSQFCTAMLKGLYPTELNSPTCAHNAKHDSQCAGLNGHIKCSTALEDAFSRSKTCSDFQFEENNTIRVFDAWDVEQMGVTTVVINIKYTAGDETSWREMTPLVYNVKKQSSKTYIAEEHQQLNITRDVNNSLLISNIGCGDMYGFVWKNIVGEGTGYLTYAEDTCETTNCQKQSFTTNPFHGFEKIRENGYFGDNSSVWPTNILKQGDESGVTTRITADEAANIAINNIKYNQVGMFIRDNLDGRIWYYTSTPDRSDRVVDTRFSTYSAGKPVSNQDSCCKCNGGTTNQLLVDAMNSENTDYVVHTIQLYHDKTWCDMSNNIFETSGALHSECQGPNANTNNFDSIQQTCISHTDLIQCTLDDLCIYDLSVDNQREVRNVCNSMDGQADACDSDIRCLYYTNTGKCSVRTFCRARTCEDTINNIGISDFCRELNIPDWCPAEPDNVKVSYTYFDSENVYLKNIEGTVFNASDIEDCARKVANMGKEMFEYDQSCLVYNKIFDLKTGVGKTTYRINGFQELAFDAYQKQFGDQCFALSSEVTSVASLSKENPAQLFFKCWNLREKNYPFVMSATGSPRGGIKLMHESQFKNFVSSVGSARQDRRWNANLFSPINNNIEVNAKWCKQHIDSRYPTGSMATYASAKQTAKDFEDEPYATICSDGVGQPDICMGFHHTASTAAKHALFWEQAFQRYKGQEWGCVTRNRNEPDTWDPGETYTLSCLKKDIAVNDLSTLTPKELESCVVTPNMNAVLWYRNTFDMLTRTRTSCENIYSTTKTILNNAIKFKMVLDSADSATPLDQFIPDDTIPLPHLLYKSRLQSINQFETDVFYLHRSGTCSGNCMLHTNAPYNLPEHYFQNMSSVNQWCDEHIECDGFTHIVLTSQWYPWSFVGDGYKYVDNRESYIKSTSLDDDCSAYADDVLFKPVSTRKSEYFIPDVSQTVVVGNERIEISKRHAGSIFMDGWSDDLVIESSNRLYITGTSPDNPLMVTLNKVQASPSGRSFQTRKEAEHECYNNQACKGLLFNIDDYDMYGFPTQSGGVIYETTSDSLNVTDNGNFYLLPKLHVFNITSENTVQPTVEPYDLKIVWPMVHDFGEVNINCYDSWVWSLKDKPKADLTWCSGSNQWSVGDTVVTKYGVITIKQVLEDKFGFESSNTLYNASQLNVTHMKTYTTPLHVNRSVEDKTISPVKICMHNPRYDNGIVFDYWVLKTPGCKFESTYYANGTIIISPDGIDMHGTYTIGMATLTQKHRGVFVKATRQTLSYTVYYGEPAFVGAATAIRSIPFITFVIEGTIAVSFTRNNVECFGLDIIDNFAYINKHFGMSIPAVENGWEIRYLDGKIYVNDNPGVMFQGNGIPNKIHIWNSVDNTIGTIINLRRNGKVYSNIMLATNHMKWSSTHSMHPGRTYSAIQTKTTSYSEQISLKPIVKWSPGDWITTNTTIQQQFNSSNQDHCVQRAYELVWTNGPPHYVSFKENVCTVYWDTIMLKSSSSNGEVAVLHRLQYHATGWIYATSSLSSKRSIQVTDAVGHSIASVSVRYGEIVNTNTPVTEDEWHLWSLDIVRVMPKVNTATIQIVKHIAGQEVAFEENDQDTHLAVYSTVGTEEYRARSLSVVPILKASSLVINGTVWLNTGIDEIGNVSYFNCTDMNELPERATLTYTSYMMDVLFEIDDTIVSKSSVEVAFNTLDAGYVKMSNYAFDDTEFKMETVRVRNRRANSMCNVKNMLFSLSNEIAIQECKYSQQCYEDFQKTNKFEMCDANIQYSVPPDIIGDDEVSIASELQWISYCDYAFPHSIHYKGLEEQCEGMWIALKVNNQAQSIEITNPLKTALGVKYAECDNSDCANMTLGFVSSCNNVCRRASFVYLTPEDEEKEYLIASGTERLTIEILDWKMVRCNNENDHAGIHTGNWYHDCRLIDDRFPVLECMEGKHVEAWNVSQPELLGAGQSLDDCRTLLRESAKYPTVIEISDGKCWALYNTEILSDFLTPVEGVRTCFIQYGGIPDIMKPPESYTVPDCNAYPYDEVYFKNCFDKTAEYTSACSETCINRLRREIDDKDCSKVKNMRDISRLTGKECTSGGCQQALDDFVSKQFCAYQEEYHTITTDGLRQAHTLKIPDLENTECSSTCKNHLERALDYNEWEDWCLNYASGNIVGTCSRTDCSCNEGYDGTQCELKCPMGSSDGKDATCSGTNGFCLAKDNSDIFTDKSRQDTAGEYDSTLVTNYPPWMTGPSTVKGICECVVGSGEACELMCTNNNNGTYGPLHLNQYGICDTYLAITKPLPPCTRYNSFALTDQSSRVSSNSTTYDRSRIVYPERLMFCTDNDMLDGAVLSSDSTEALQYNTYELLDEADLSDVSFETHVKRATRVFQHICFPHPNSRVYTYIIEDDTSRTFSEGPEYIPAHWYVEGTTANIEDIWLNSISDSWLSTRLLSRSNGYFEHPVESYLSKTISQCAKLCAQKYDMTHGLFVMEESTCHLQNATIMTKEQFENSGTLIFQTNKTQYFIDLEDVPLEDRTLKRNIESKRHTNGTSIVLENIVLFVEEMPIGFSNAELRASLDKGAVSAHVIVYGPLPYNRKYPSLVSMGENTILMFGGRLLFGEQNEDSDELFRIDTSSFHFGGQSVVTASISIPETSGSTPSARANAVMAFSDKVYLFGGNIISYDVEGKEILSPADTKLWTLDIDPQVSVSSSENIRSTWLWSSVKSISYGVYNPTDLTRQPAWVANGYIFMDHLKLWTGSVATHPNTVQSSTETCDQCRVSSPTMATQTMGCNVTVVDDKLYMTGETLSIGKFGESPVDMRIWVHDWAMIDPDFGSDFLLRYKNIFHRRIAISNGPYTLQEAIPRARVYNKTGTESSGAVVFSERSQQECENLCRGNCTSYSYDEVSGNCTLGTGQYQLVSARGQNLPSVNTSMINNVHKLFKRAKMMQGRYSVLDELGVILPQHTGYDWMIRTEVNPSLFTRVPVSDGSRRISLSCIGQGCGRAGAVTFQKAKYTKKEAQKICGTMDPADGCEEPCQLSYDALFRRYSNVECSNNPIKTVDNNKCDEVCTETAGCTGFTMNTTHCGLYNTCSRTSVLNSLLYEKRAFCDTVSTFTIPQVYYMVDVVTPIVAHSESYKLIQGPEVYMLNVHYSFTKGETFDTGPLNMHSSVWTMDGRNIVINITNTQGVGGIRILWTDNKGWLFKSREPFEHYYVSQTKADRNLHRGGMCGGSASDTCPGVETYYNVPCNGHGVCELSCECVCDKSPEEYYLDASRNIGSAPDDPSGATEDGVSSLTQDKSKSPFRGPDCSITCPGYDGWSVKNVCSGRGTCGDRGQCICNYGFSGDNCQFTCPGFDSGSSICGKKGSCSMIDISATSFRSNEYNNKKRFTGAIRKYYRECNDNIKADGLKLYVGEPCTANDECHTNICDINGTYHGCKGMCVQPNPIEFPSKYGILMDKKPKHEDDISPEWRDYNCPKDNDLWYTYDWIKLTGEIGVVGSNGEFIVQSPTQSLDCESNTLCIAFNGNQSWIENNNKLSFRSVDGGTPIWIKNPFDNQLSVFETNYVEDGKQFGSTTSSEGHKYTISNAMKGKLNNVCQTLSSQVGEIPWVLRPMLDNFIQIYDEPLEDYMINGYPFQHSWGYDPDTGKTTIRDLNAPTLVSKRMCEIIPGFVLRCGTCDCFSDSIQGFWAGPMCSECARGYATLTCKKICPGYDGKNERTMCSGNGVCNFGKEGTGRCMCGGVGASQTNGGYFPLYKDQDFLPRSATTEWCNSVKQPDCDLQPYCTWSSGKCMSTQTQDDRPSVIPTWPKAQEYTYYFVWYRDFSTFIWPKRKNQYVTFNEGQVPDIRKWPNQFDIVPIGIMNGFKTWHPEGETSSLYFYEKTNSTSITKKGDVYYSLSEAKGYCDHDKTCVGISSPSGGWGYSMLTAMDKGSGSLGTWSKKLSVVQEGCTDFGYCDNLAGGGQLSTICSNGKSSNLNNGLDTSSFPRLLGNNPYEGCCECGGGLRGHGIPESATRWLHKAYKEDTCVNSNADRTYNLRNNTNMGRDDFCNFICHDGIPLLPVDNEDWNEALDGCCSCGSIASQRPTFFWNVRMSAGKKATSTGTTMGQLPPFATTPYPFVFGKIKNWWTPRAYDKDNIAAKVNTPYSFMGYTERLYHYESLGYSECPFQDKTACENDCKLCTESFTGYSCSSPCTLCFLGGSCKNEPSDTGSSLCTCVSDSLDPLSGCCPKGFALITGSSILERSNQINGIKAGLVIFQERNVDNVDAAAIYFKNPVAPSGTTDIKYLYSTEEPNYDFLKRQQIQAGCYPCPGIFAAQTICDDTTCSTTEDYDRSQERMWQLTTQITQDNTLWKLEKPDGDETTFPFPFSTPVKLKHKWILQEGRRVVWGGTVWKCTQGLQKCKEYCEQYEECKYITIDPWNAPYPMYAFINSEAKLTDRWMSLVSAPAGTEIPKLYIKKGKLPVKLPYINELSKTYLGAGAFSGACGGASTCTPYTMDVTTVEGMSSIFSSRLGCSTCEVTRFSSNLDVSVSVGCVHCPPGSYGNTIYERLYEYCYPNDACPSINMEKWETNLTEPEKICGGALSNNCKKNDKPLSLYLLKFKPSTGCTWCPPGKGFGFDMDRDGFSDDLNETDLSSYYGVTKCISDKTNLPLIIKDNNLLCNNYGTPDRFAGLGQKGLSVQWCSDTCFEDSTCNYFGFKPDLINGYNICALYESCDIFESAENYTVYKPEPVTDLLSSPGRFCSIKCVDCPVDSYSSKTSNCKKCPFGYTTNGLEGQETCTTCPAGKFYSLDSNNCVSCGPGTYQPERNIISFNNSKPANWPKPNNLFYLIYQYGGCLVCPAGKTHTLSEQIDDSQCGPCAEGFIPDVVHGGCILCPEGTTSLSGDDTCKCSVGWAGVGDACTECGTAGSHPNKQAQASSSGNVYETGTGAEFCVNCPAGKGNVDGNACDFCEAGKFTATVGDVCTECSKGQYQHEQGKTVCITCDPGKYHDELGNTVECKSCEPGKSQSGVGGHSCDNCVPGKYQDQTGAENCKDCPSGKQQAEMGQAECNECELWKLYLAGTANTEFCSMIKRCYQGENCAINNNNECDYQTPINPLWETTSGGGFASLGILSYNLNSEKCALACAGNPECTHFSIETTFNIGMSSTKCLGWDSNSYSAYSNSCPSCLKLLC